MNCHRFQDLLFEYLDATLPSELRADAAAHLAACPACRHALEQHRQFAQSLSRSFQQATEPLTLHPDTRHLVLDQLGSRGHSPAEVGVRTGVGSESFPYSILRFLQPLSIAAALVLAAALMTGFPFGTRVPTLQIARNEPRAARSPVSIHVSYCAPTYTFRQEGGFVIDYLTCNPSVVELTLWPADNQNPATIKPRTSAPSFE